MQDDDRFATIRNARRIWAVAAVHAEFDRLRAVHDRLETRIRTGDRLVYLGNCIGRGERVAETVRELLLFRRAVLARPGMEAEDVVYLRGSQEEMWQKLLQLHIAPNPAEVLRWMIGQGVGATLTAYGGDPEQGLQAAREGAVALSRWTNALRAAVRRNPGHEAFMTAVRRAAFTDDNALLFVHAGVDPTRPLPAQRDTFWWGAGGFSRIDRPYGDFRRVVRGFDRRHRGVVEHRHTVSLDAGCGFGGPLVAACFAPEGALIHRIEE